MDEMKAEALVLALKFHETYERLAPSFGYETRTETRAFDPESPNGKLMIAVCGELAATRPATDTAVEEARSKLRAIISHASGGHLSEPADVDRGMNDICVEITRHVNRVWGQAQKSALAEVSTPIPQGAAEGLVDYTQTAFADLSTELGKLDSEFPNYADWPVTLPAGHWRAILSALQKPQDSATKGGPE